MAVTIPTCKTGTLFISFLWPLGWKHKMSQGQKVEYEER